MLNPSYCQGCSDRGMQLGLCNARVVQLEALLGRVIPYDVRLTERRDVLQSPLTHRKPSEGPW